MKKFVRPASIFFLSLSISILGSPESHAAISISAITSSPISSTGGGSGGTATCTSPTVVNSIGSYTYPYDGTTLSQTTAYCATLAASGLTISATGSQTLGGYGSAYTAGTFAQVDCSTNGGNRVVVGARVYKTPNGYTAGVLPLCGTLPSGSSRSNASSTIGATTATYEDIACNTGSVAVGLNVRYGGILDTFGIQCAQLQGATQTISVASLGTSSKTNPYSQVLSMSTSGSSGTGAITYSISAGGTASGCTLSNSTASATLTASSSGTCLITATIASDTNFAAATSTAATFTFNGSVQSALSISSTTGSYGTPLTLTSSGGSGSGAISFTYAAGTTTCSLSGSTLTANGVGTCLITATKASDANYQQISSSQTTVSFTQGTSTTTLTVAVGNLVYRQAKLLTAVASVAGKVSFKINNAFIPGCRNKLASAGNSYTITCSYRPAVHGAIRISAILNPTDLNISGVTSTSGIYYVAGRTGTR